MKDGLVVLGLAVGLASGATAALVGVSVVQRQRRTAFFGGTPVVNGADKAAVAVLNHQANASQAARAAQERLDLGVNPANQLANAWMNYGRAVEARIALSTDPSSAAALQTSEANTYTTVRSVTTAMLAKRLV